VKDWDEILTSASKEERDTLFYDALLDVAGLDIMEDRYTLDEFVGGVLKLVSVAPRAGAVWLREELQEEGRDITAEEALALSDEHKRTLIREFIEKGFFSA